MEADRLRFRAPPATDVRFWGTPDYDSVSSARRRNIPEPVAEDVDYPDVRVDYLLAARLRRLAYQRGRRTAPRAQTEADERQAGEQP